MGSEGTLGIITKITLKLTHLPKNTSVVSVCFANLADLADSVHEIIRNEIPLGCVELMDKEMVNILLHKQSNNPIT